MLLIFLEKFYLQKYDSSRIMQTYFFFFFFCVTNIFGQNKELKPTTITQFPQGYFVEPTDSSLKIAGNFGEIRPNHFHAGLDIKTGGREGVYILSAADGYVSRIKISPYGYGKCIYITHPNGYVTLYSHLQRFYGKIAKYIKLEQYKAEMYDVELFPDSNLLLVRQHDTVALSGNTGGSQAPHLHFEIRDAKIECAYNPFLFGYKLNDSFPPKIPTLAIYPANDFSSVNGKNVLRKIGVYGNKGKYKISSAEKITVHGDIGFGIETYDYANIPEAGKLGAYSIDLYIDGQRIYYHELNKISFDESRYINSHIDYAENMRSRKQIQKCFRDENNNLSIYQCILNEGLFRFDDTSSHLVKFIVKDFFKNSSVLEFKVQSLQQTSISFGKGIEDKSQGIFFKCNELNKYKTQNIKIEIPPRALYKNLNFDYSISEDTLPHKFAPVHTIHKSNVPLHTNYSLSIKTKPIPEKYQSKVTIVLLDGKNYMTNQKGEYKDGWITTQTKYFGRFTVAIDTVPPSIKPYNIYNGKNMSHAKTISVIISDNLTGIKSYRPTIDDKWILMEYEPKKALLFYEFDERIEKGNHIFQIEVVDEKNNISIYKAEFMR
ncbi:MAG: M23 family metallopeptidase [Bacteroidota bacterium]